LIIAATAIEHDCLVVHADRHFEMIARHSLLRTKKFD
jgi:predicted nucleic acid-binding protein